MSGRPSDAIRDRTAALLGWTPAAWRPVSGGYTPAARYRVSAGADSAFVKVATTPLTARFLRQEAAAYACIRGSFIPHFHGWVDDPDEPMLVVEDLGEARWPPPWDRASLDSVLEQIEAMHGTAAPLTALPPLTGPTLGWADVARDPAPFLSLSVAGPEWLSAALPQLIEAEANCPTSGSSLTHFDLRSDNMCLTGRGAKFVDWTEARMGNPNLDLGFWLPSLHFEGGPEPEALLPDAPDVAAWVSGYFARGAGLPVIPDAPFVRRVQREQLSTALPWVQRALRLDRL